MGNYRYVIYAHINKINGMAYVGRTHLNPVHRWGLNGSGYKNHNIFWQAIQEYGWDNFHHEILKYGIKKKSEADELEKKYIKELNSLYPNGYNVEDGGIHGSNILNKKEGEIKMHRPHSGWHHSKETIDKIRNNQPDIYLKRRKSVECYDLNGNFIKEYTGASEASEELNIDISTIAKCCKHPERWKTAGGYIWKYKIS